MIKEFCKKWNSEFIVLDKDLDLPGDYDRSHYRLLDLYDEFPDYDRIFIIDSDLIILPTCPNPFEVVPEDKIGSILEDKGSRKMARLNEMMLLQRSYGDIGWREDWPNTGVFMTSKMHAPIFKKFEGKIWRDNDDCHFGFMIKHLGFEYHELPYQFNHTSMYSEPWNGNADRFDSYIIHYAGRAAFPGHVGTNSCEDKLKLLRQDYEKIYG
jgi:lipopolysaccharide biosynthesis glycosyltransferase